MATTHETEGVINALVCNCGSTWTFKDGAVEYKSGKPQPKKEQGEPVAWRTFDGEGLYFYCSYEDNETYADVWNKRNPNHKGWVEPLYTTPQQRTWVGLTDEEEQELDEKYGDDINVYIDQRDLKLKEKNT